MYLAAPAKQAERGSLRSLEHRRRQPVDHDQHDWLPNSSESRASVRRPGVRVRGTPAQPHTERETAAASR